MEVKKHFLLKLAFRPGFGHQFNDSVGSGAWRFVYIGDNRGDRVFGFRLNTQTGTLAVIA
jgi:hypothetical protein